MEIRHVVHGSDVRSRSISEFGVLAVVLLTLGVLTGCGGSAESHVSGDVSLDGTPLDHGSVTFVPSTEGGRTASGSIDSSGGYSVQSGKTQGLPAGEYTVKVTSFGPSIPHPQGGPPAMGKLLTPKKYAGLDTSDLKLTVVPGSNDLDIELTTD